VTPTGDEGLAELLGSGTAIEGSRPEQSVDVLALFFAHATSIFRRKYFPGTWGGM
jgi:hypothetical protein